MLYLQIFWKYLFWVHEAYFMLYYRLVCFGRPKLVCFICSFSCIIFFLLWENSLFPEMICDSTSDGVCLMLFKFICSCGTKLCFQKLEIYLLFLQPWQFLFPERKYKSTLDGVHLMVFYFIVSWEQKLGF